MMRRVLAACAAMLIGAMLLSSCAHLSGWTRGGTVIPVRHVRGGEATCLADCAVMVLSYYGASGSPAALRGSPGPTRLRTLDSLLNLLPGPAPDQRVQSFVLRRDGAFVVEQLHRQRPVILIVRGRQQWYHSVVVSGISADGRRMLVHDPARRNERWVRWARLERQWQEAGGILLLVGVVKKPIRDDA